MPNIHTFTAKHIGIKVLAAKTQRAINLTIVLRIPHFLLSVDINSYFDSGFSLNLRSLFLFGAFYLNGNLSQHPKQGKHRG